MNPHIWFVSALCALTSICALGCDLPSECAADDSCRETYGSTFYCAEDGICDQYTEGEYTAAPCDFETFGPVFEPGTINVGAIFALDPTKEFNGLIEPIARAAKIAVGDVNTVGIDGRKMGMIFCDTQGEEEVAKAAAEHLRSIGIQAVVGPDFSGYTSSLVPEFFVPNGIFSISPSATAETLSTLEDEDLFWRTVPSDDTQGRVLRNLYQDVVARSGLTNPKVAMMVLEEDDYAGGLKAATLEVMPEGDRFLTLNYPNKGKGGGDDYSNAVIEVAAFNPDIVLIWGLTEIWDIIPSLDNLLETDSARTDVLYISADAGRDNVLSKRAIQERPSLKNRVFGTAPRSLNPDEYTPYKAFRVRWDSDYDTTADEHQFITNSYDAVYLLALAYAKAGPNAKGPQLAKAVREIVLGDDKTTVTANQQSFASNAELVTQGKSLNIQGTSGILDFNDSGEIKPATIALWCLDEDGASEKGELLRPDEPQVFIPQTCTEASQ